MITTLHVKVVYTTKLTGLWIELPLEVDTIVFSIMNKNCKRFM